MWSDVPPLSRSRLRSAAITALLPWTVLLWAALVLGTPPLGAQPTEGAGEVIVEPKTTESSEPASDPVPISAGGLRVFVDPETGEILATPRPEQIRELAALERQRLASPTGAIANEPVRVFAIPGGVGAVLPRSLMSSMVLRVLPDGSFETVCVDHVEGDDHEHPAAIAERPATADGGEVR